MPLHPLAQQLVDDSRASGRPNAHLLPVEVARQNFEGDLAPLEKPPVAEIGDVQIPTRNGAQIPGRLYRPSTGEALPLIVYFHGGGWLLGSVDSHDVTTRRLALTTGAAVLSVGYRRGPEARFPAAALDAYDAAAWASTPGNVPNVDTSRLALAGDSAGGNLAASVALQARDFNGPKYLHQLLVYPVTTCDLDRGMDPEYEGVMLFRDELQWHQDNYLCSREDATDPRVDVLDANLADLPPASIVLAECDPIRPQGELYAAALRAAGNEVSVYQQEGMIHGFFGLDEVFPTAAEAMEFASGRLRDAFSAAVRA